MVTRGATSVCAYEWSGYPHGGCAEFGPPDTFSCSAPATTRVWFAPTGEAYEDPYGTVVDFCAEHAEGIAPPDVPIESVPLLALPQDVRCDDCGQVVWILHPNGHTLPCDYCARQGVPTTAHPECVCPDAASELARALHDEAAR